MTWFFVGVIVGVLLVVAAFQLLDRQQRHDDRRHPHDGEGLE